MKFLYHTLSRFRVNDNVMVIRVKTDGSTLFVTMRTPTDSTLPEIPLSIGYNGTVQQMTKPTPAEMRAEFPYSDAAKQIDLYGATVVYRERSVSSLSWQGGSLDPDPEVSVVIDGVRLNSANVVRKVPETVPAGTNLELVEVRMFDKDPGQTSWTHRVYAYNNSFLHDPYVFYAGADMEEGTEVWFRMLYACYVPGDESNHDAYKGLCEIDTEHAFATGASAPYCPREVRVSNVAVKCPPQLDAADGFGGPDHRDRTGTLDRRRRVRGGHERDDEYVHGSPARIDDAGRLPGAFDGVGRRGLPVGDGHPGGGGDEQSPRVDRRRMEDGRGDLGRRERPARRGEEDDPRRAHRMK